ncbi:MAG TPA: ferrous iron transport protein B [Syntrophomonadaceae bacterium]|nr:ferrous iron transport protein B [Syntrophomonadaceae bacterium]HRX20493.1 ferrous iron transport protein B [Syntrophomonadaceae bacterium]
MTIVMIGNPNVGKSAVLSRLTDRPLLVSNYSGTSVEITATQLKSAGKTIDIYDTPGIYSMECESAEQQVINELINSQKVDLILNIVDAVNLERNLVLTYELLELGIPMVLVINQIDRARQMGIEINCQLLSQILKCEVICFSANTGEGLMELMSLIDKGNKEGKTKDKETGQPVTIIKAEFAGNSCNGNCANCSRSFQEIDSEDLKRAGKAADTARMVTREFGTKSGNWMDKAEKIIDKPFLGTIILLFVAYLAFLALMKFIELSEGPISDLLAPVNSVLEAFILTHLPDSIFTTILAKAVPEGLIIPFTIIMPAMLMVSIIMSLIEDTGLLPRYSVVLERVGSFFGLSGQAVIPLSLGFGCRTPAVMATRILPNQQQRFIAIVLLSVVIPCAATLGILASVIATFEASLMVIMVTMIMTLIIIGYVLSRIMSTEEVFIYELPPLRIPLWSNLWTKLKIRFSGFFTEVLPLLLVMSIAVRALIESGLLNHLQSIENITRMLFGIPAEAFAAVLLTIFQRYLAPLILLNLDLSAREATIAISMIALSLPCLPVMVMTVREIGFKGLTKVLAIGMSTSILVGIILNLLLP